MQARGRSTTQTGFRRPISGLDHVLAMVAVGLWGAQLGAPAIWQDLVSDHGFAASYASVQRSVRKLAGEKTPEARAIILTAPGEEGQVDYGDGPMVRDAGSGKYRRARVFVLTLGFSRKSVRPSGLPL